MKTKPAPQTLILILGMLAYFLVFSALSVLRHNAFASNFDLANMDQTVWNTLSGRFFSLSTEYGTLSRLSIHADFILIFLAPLYLIWNDVRILLLTQSFFLALGAIPAYLLAQKILENKNLALVVSFLYLLNPALQWANLYDFHPVTLAIPFLLFCFYFALEKKWVLYWSFFLLSLITKEEISLILSLFGLILFFAYRQRKIGLTSFLLGAAWFLTMVFLIIPFFGPTNQHWAFDAWYQNPSPQTLFSLSSFSYYFDLLKGYSFLPLLGFPWLILSLPEIAINVSSSFPAMKTISLHYQSGAIPGLTLALIFGLKKIPRQFLKTVSLVILTVGIFLFLAQGPFPTNPACWCVIYDQGKDEKEFARLLSTIPDDASIAASREIRPHLTHREVAVNLPPLPDNVDYIALIDQERYVGNFGPRPEEIELIEKINSGGKYQLVKKIGHYYLYKKSVFPKPFFYQGSFL